MIDSIDDKEFVLDKLLDPQIESIFQETGSEDATPPGMISFKEYFQTVDMMQVLIFRLLDNYDDDGIQNFVAGRKAVYNPDIDRFVTL